MDKSLRTPLIVLALVLVAIIAYVLWSVAPVTTPGSTGTSTAMQPPTATEPQIPATWKTWTDTDVIDDATNPTAVYSISYPADFEVREGDQASGGSFIGTTRASFTFPRNAFAEEKTNFAGGGVIISVLKNASAERCYQDPQDPTKTLTATETINGTLFYKGTAADAGAGNFYESRVYRTLYAGNCYEFVLLLHTTNVGNYDPGTVTEFDKTQAWDVLDQIMHTVR